MPLFLKQLQFRLDKIPPFSLLVVLYILEPTFASVENGGTLISTPKLLGVVEHLAPATLRAGPAYDGLHLEIFSIDSLYLGVLGA